jgi:hypothetical protein
MVSRFEPVFGVIADARERQWRQRRRLAVLLAAVAVGAWLAVVSFAGRDRGVGRSGAIAHARTQSGGQVAVAAMASEYPFGALSVAADGTLYYVDRQRGQIDEATGWATRLALSSLRGGTEAGQSIAGLSGLFVADGALWFSAAGSLYKATLRGGQVRRVGEALGAFNLDVLPDGTVLYTTSGARTTSAGVFERIDRRAPRRVAGGGTVAFNEQLVGEHPATALADIDPVNVVGVSRHVFYFVNENNLYLVEHGQATALRPLGEFFNGELAAVSHGVVYGICGRQICRIRGRTVTPLVKLPTRVGRTFVAPDALAVSPTGSFYIAYSSQSGPTTNTGIVELTPSGTIARIVVSRNTHTA